MEIEVWDKRGRRLHIHDMVLFVKQGRLFVGEVTNIEPTEIEVSPQETFILLQCRPRDVFKLAEE